MQDKCDAGDNVIVGAFGASDQNCPDCGKRMRETSTDGVSACDRCHLLARIDGQMFADGTRVRRGSR